MIRTKAADILFVAVLYLFALAVEIRPQMRFDELRDDDVRRRSGVRRFADNPVAESFDVRLDDRRRLLGA